MHKATAMRYYHFSPGIGKRAGHGDSGRRQPFFV